MFPSHMRLVFAAVAASACLTSFCYGQTIEPIKASTLGGKLATGSATMPLDRHGPMSRTGADCGYGSLSFADPNYRREAFGSANLPAVQSMADSNVQYVGSCLWSGINDVVVDGDLAYCALSNGLMVLDVSTVSAPDSVGSLYLNSRAWELEKAGDMVYVAVNRLGLVVVDVSDPGRPTTVGSCDTGGSAFGLYVQDSTAFVVGDSGLVIIDVSDPIQPGVVGLLPAVGYWDVSIQAGQAFTCNDTGLHVIDISDLTAPTQIGYYRTERAQRVYVQDTIAYVTIGYEGLLILNVKNAAEIILITSYNTQSPYDYFRGLVVRGTTAYLSVLNTGLILLDVSDPGNPHPVGEFRNCAPASIFVQDSLVYISEHYLLDQVLILNVADATQPVVAGTFEFPGHLQGVVARNTLGYLVGKDGLLIIDLSDPIRPVLSCSCDSTKYAYSVAIQDDLAYLVNYGTQFNVVNVSDPADPRRIGGMVTPATVYDVFVQDNFAYVANATNGLHVIDVSEPTDPHSVCSRPTSDHTTGVYVQGDFAFFTDQDSLHVASDACTDVGSYVFLDRPSDVFLANNRAYVTTHNWGLYIMDVSNPYHPAPLGSYHTRGGARGVFVADNLAYVGEGSAGLEIIDISDPAHPVLSGRYDTPGYVESVFAQDSLIMVADRYSLLILKRGLDVDTSCCVGNRGDVNYDSADIVDIADLMYLIDYMFTDGPLPVCHDEADVNADGAELLDIADLVYLIDYMFRGGPAPMECP